MMKTDLPNPFYMAGVYAYLSADSEKLNHTLNSDQLNQIEKRLLRARMEIRQRNWQKAKDLISEVKTESKFYQGEVHFLLGNIEGFNANWESAILQNMDAYKYYQQCHNRRGLFLSCYNLSVDYLNLGLLDISSKYLKLAQENAENELHQQQIFRGLAWNAVCQGDQKSALNYIDQGLKNISDDFPSEKNAFLSVAADIFFRVGQIDEAYEIMKQLKYSKAVRDKSRINFEFKLLEKMKSEKKLLSALDAPTAEIALSKEYFVKWSILKSLLAGDKMMAQQYWTQLIALFPRFYAQNYVCTDQIESKSIFMVFLNRINNSITPKEDVSENYFFESKLTQQQHQLLQVLKQYPEGLRKEDLIETLWRIKYDPSLDAKFYKVIERLKKQSEVAIARENQRYKIAK